MPWIEMLRLVNSGTEATMSALRLARAATGRNKIIKFDGGYHGHVDSLLVKAGSGAATFNVPDSAGVPPDVTKLTVSVAYNNLDAVRAAMDADVAAIIVEPVAGNMGLVPPRAGFLPGLRDLADNSGALLIFDEVMTGFRVAHGGAQARYGVTPDLTCLGKVIGGGLPAAAYGGRREIMELIAPAGPVYQAGTLSGNPLAMAAGVTTLRAIGVPGVFERLEQVTTRLCEGFLQAAHAADVPLQAAAVGSMWGFFFAAAPIGDYASAKQHADTAQYARFFHAMLDREVYLAPSQFEAAFVSLAHDDALVERTIAAAREAFALVRA